MVRAPPAVAHTPLHHQDLARGDRAGHHRGLHALPARVAGVTREPRPQGVESLAAIVEQLEGFEAPAAAWESDVLRVRMQDYDPNWLDSLCLSGRATWQRLTPPKAATGGPVRATPITLLTRKNSALWHSLEEQGMDETSLSHPARAILEYLRTHGASFFDEIVSGAGILHA